jgi:hypothetical protein
MKLTKRRAKQLQRRLEENKALPTARLDEEPLESNKNDESPLLNDLRSLDAIIDSYIRKQASGRDKKKF